MVAFAALFAFCFLFYAGPAVAANLSADDDSPSCLTGLVVKQATQLQRQEDQQLSLQEKVKSLEAVVESLKTLVETRGKKEKQVSFRATLNKPVTANAPIPFDLEFQSGHTAYNSHTGVFTIPVSGVYLFTFQFFPSFLKDILYDLYVDSNIQIRSRCYSSTTYSNSCSSASFLRLQKGAKVWMQATVGGKYHGGLHSFFSGALITPDP